MASEDGAGIVSNIGCDVNNTSQRAIESVGSETVGVTSSGATSRIVVEETDDRARDSARHSPRTPTDLPAASPFHTNTEGHTLQRDTGLASSSGDVAESVASSKPDNETQQPSPQRRSMSRHDSDLDDTACLPGEPDGNLLPCYPFRCAKFLERYFQTGGSSLMSMSFVLSGCICPSSLTASYKAFVPMFQYIEYIRYR